MSETSEEYDFKNTIAVFLKGIEVVVEAEDRSYREGVYARRTSVVYRRLLVGQHIDNSTYVVEIIFQSRVFWTIWKTGLIQCASKEGIALVKAWTNYCWGGCFCSSGLSDEEHEYESMTCFAYRVYARERSCSPQVMKTQLCSEPSPFCIATLPPFPIQLLCFAAFFSN